VVVDAGNLGPPDYPSSSEVRLDSTTQVFKINREELPELPELRTGERISVWTYDDPAYEQILVYQVRTPDGTWIDPNHGNHPAPAISPHVAALQWPLLACGALLTIGAAALWVRRRFHIRDME
jgi:hypothetical protein